MTSLSATIDSLLDFLVRYPILPPLFFYHSTICSIPVLLLLVVTQKCALHRNCRYLISFWCLSLLGTLANIIALNAQTMTFHKGYIPRGIVDPTHRPHFLMFHSMFYASSSCFEMFIAFERILSTRNPHMYHVSGTHWAALIPLTVFAVEIINYFGIRYCKRRFESLYGKASLNARYQANEAYEMARAMHPVYCVSFLLKVFGMVIAYTYILLMPYFKGPIYTLMDSGYFYDHGFNCAFSSLFLIFNHKSIRNSALTLVGRKRANEIPVIHANKNTSETTNKYFSMLENSWK